MLENLNPDIAICPLSSHPFNMSKSNLKVLEMGAFGIPCIASNFGPYQFVRHMTDGLLVDNGTPGIWHDSLNLLINNKELRCKLGTAMRARVQEEFSWDTDSPNRRAWQD